MKKNLKIYLLTRILGAENATTQNDIRFIMIQYLENEPIFNDASVHFLNNPLGINYLNIDEFEFELIDKLVFDLKKFYQNYTRVNEPGLKILKII